MEGAGQAAPAAQHTPHDLAGQPAAAAGPWRLPRPLVPAVAWWILGVWLAVDSGVVAYWASREWGFLGDLLLILALLWHFAGLIVWITALALLAQAAWPWRVGYFLIGTAAMVALTEFIFYATEPSLVWAWAAFVVGLSVPLLWMRRRGWRICARGLDPLPGAKSRRNWQFSVGDILIATTQAGAFLALTAATRISRLDEITILAVVLLVSPAFVVVGLSWRRFTYAVPACLSISALPTIGLLVWHDASLGDIGLILLLVAVGVVSLLVAIGAMRSFGYRLRSPGSLLNRRSVAPQGHPQISPGPAQRRPGPGGI